MMKVHPYGPGLYLAWDGDQYLIVPVSKDGDATTVHVGAIMRWWDGPAHVKTVSKRPLLEDDQRRAAESMNAFLAGKHRRCTIDWAPPPTQMSAADRASNDESYRRDGWTEVIEPDGTRHWKPPSRRQIIARWLGLSKRGSS